MEPIGDREPGDMRILWGRVAALGAALLVAFLLGTWLGGGDEGVDPEEWDQLVSELEEERQRNEELNDYIDELSAGEADGQADDAPTADDAGSDDTSDDGTGAAGEDGAAADEGGEGGDAEGQVYEVRSGDSLTGIAQRFYGNTDAYERIVEANDLDPDEPLQVGQELVIPPAED